MQDAEGYRYAIVAGQVTYRDGVATGALPGRLVQGLSLARLSMGPGHAYRSPRRRWKKTRIRRPSSCARGDRLFLRKRFTAWAPMA